MVGVELAVDEVEERHAGDAGRPQLRELGDGGHGVEAAPAATGDRDAPRVAAQCRTRNSCAAATSSTSP